MITNNHLFLFIGNIHKSHWLLFSKTKFLEKSRGYIFRGLRLVKTSDISCMVAQSNCPFIELVHVSSEAAKLSREIHRLRYSFQQPSSKRRIPYPVSLMPGILYKRQSVSLIDSGSERTEERRNHSAALKQILAWSRKPGIETQRSVEKLFRQMFEWVLS